MESELPGKCVQGVIQHCVGCHQLQYLEARKVSERNRMRYTRWYCYTRALQFDIDRFPCLRSTEEMGNDVDLQDWLTEHEECEDPLDCHVGQPYERIIYK